METIIKREEYNPPWGKEIPQDFIDLQTPIKLAYPETFWSELEGILEPSEDATHMPRHFFEFEGQRYEFVDGQYFQQVSYM